MGLHAARVFLAGLQQYYFMRAAVSPPEGHTKQFFPGPNSHTQISGRLIPVDRWRFFGFRKSEGAKC